MFQWIPYAFVRIVLFFSAGILLAVSFPDLVPEGIIQIFLFSLLTLYTLIFFVNRYFVKINHNLGYIGLATVFTMGYLNVLQSTDARKDNHLSNLPDTIQYYQCVVTSEPYEKERTWKIEAHVQQVKTDRWKDYQGNVMLYIPKKDFSKPYQYGDVLIIKGHPEEVPAPANPEQFDYKRYLSYRQIYHQQFLRKGNVVFVESKPYNTLMYYAIEARQWSESVLRKYVAGEREQATLSALVLGITDGLDNDLLNAYSATGALHVLAVSGLHISIIYMIIIWLLKPLDKSRSGKWTLAVLSVFILWGYAFVTGLSPSVLRAVTMFTFVALARPWNQRTNIYNVLAASAFCLLLFDPYMIMSVGFQLSYLAVLGIVYLQPPLYRVWEPRAWIWDEVWKITSVSIAAQVATISLGLLYFHQFPNYFLIANLLVIPASFAVLILGLLLLVLNVVPVVAELVGHVVQWIITLMNEIIFTIETFPYSRIDNIYLSGWQCILLTGIIISLVLLIEYKNFRYLVTAFVLVIFFSAAQWLHHYEDINVRKMIVYKVSGHTAMDLIDHGQATFISDSVLLTDERQQNFQLQPHRLKCGVHQIENSLKENVYNGKGMQVIRWNEITILHIMNRNVVLPEKMSADYVLISNNAVRDLRSLANHVETPKFILDSSNSFARSSDILRQATALKLDVHAVHHAGAFLVTL